MSMPRPSTPVAALLALAATLSMAGVAQAVPPSATTGSVLTAPLPAIGVRSAQVGAPARNYTMLPGSYFGFPNSTKARRYAIRNRVVYTIQGVWGGPRDSLRQPVAGNGSIRIATWSFDDWTIARALVAAKNRGVSVQVVAAAQRNSDNGPWKYLQRNLGVARYVAGHPSTQETMSFARQCRGSCRGHGGTPHSKFFLFDNVGSGHHRSVVMQTSMNLTNFAYKGQWNQAQVLWSSSSWAHFMGIFRQMRIGHAVSGAYRHYTAGGVEDLFFPKPGTSAGNDPVMQTLNKVRCRGATGGGNGSRTRVRVIQYAIYDTRGLWLAKKLRSLRNAGCDVAIIYSLVTRPVLSILRGIPMRQSVIKNRRGEIVKYNHSKWMTITGNWGSDTSSYLTFSGSANWSNAAFSNDEQMQQIDSYGVARSHLANFSAVWRQRTSHAPSFGRTIVNGRATLATPQDAQFGTGMYKYLTPNG